MGRGEGGACFAYAVDGLGKLPHYFGLFGAAEIEAVGGGYGTRAGSGNVAGGFGDGVHWRQLWG